MFDSRTLAHKAFYAALNQAPAVTALAQVWAHPEENTEPTPELGLVLIDRASVSNAGGKDGGFDEVTVDIIAYARKPDVTALYELSTQIRAVLEGQAIAVTGGELSRPEFLSAEAELMEDGETYFDTLRFRTFVQPA